MSLVVVGSVAYDGVETPHGRVERMLGGAATYISLSASYFTQVRIVAVVGDDFAQADTELLASRGIDLEGLERVPGKTFFWAGKYTDDMNDRVTLTTDLNVFADFQPKLPESYQNARYLLLGNIQPSLQRSVRGQMKHLRLAGGDTMNFWISDFRAELLETIKNWDFLLINDHEARMLSGESNLRKAAAKILDMGPHTLVIKRGEYGAMLFRQDSYFIVPGYLLESVFDPTGAGDCFAGGFIGYLAEHGFSLEGDHISRGMLSRAVIYGSVMGSFCCERFGVERFRTLTREEIDADLKSSASSLRSNPRELTGVVMVLMVISATALLWCASRGYTLYLGDAEAHLNIARRVLDSRTPGAEQLGTVWLPLPHVLMLPFVAREKWWRSGIAGAIPSAAGFVAAGALLYAAARRLYASAGAGWAAALLFALNPNMLYLQATPMNEAIFAAALAALLWSTVAFRDSQSGWAVLAAAAASNAASLTRYEGWFLIPFIALYLLIASRRKSYALLFAVLAALGPLAWLAHNQYYYSNALEFYDGDFSAQAIYARQVAAGVARYPGDHNWGQALEYYSAAVTLTQGWILVALGALGAVAAFVKKRWWPLLLLALPPAFYVWSMHSSGTPLYVPALWPHSWYNTRYALAALPLAALAAAALVAILPAKLHALGAAILVMAVASSWAAAGTPACWKESAVNSGARRAWTGQAAAYLAANYRPGDGIIYSFGDLTGVLREAGIPLREGLHQGNRPAWDAAVLRPDLFFREEWVLAEAGDRVSEAVMRTGPRYRLKKRIMVEGAPAIEIYQRRWTQLP